MEQGEKCTYLDGLPIKDEDNCKNFGCCFDNDECWKMKGKSVYTFNFPPLS